MFCFGRMNEFYAITLDDVIVFTLDQTFAPLAMTDVEMTALIAS